MEGMWALNTVVLILSKYFMSCCAILIPYQITFNKGQYLTYMVSGVYLTKVAENTRKWFCVVCVCWVTAEWQTDWTTLKNTLSTGDKRGRSPYALQQDITGCCTFTSPWWMHFDLLFSLFKFHTLLANTHTCVAWSNHCHVAYQTMNKHFYNPKDIVECAWNEPSKQWAITIQ